MTPAQHEALVLDVAQGDQSWRETINVRWAASLVARAQKVADQAVGYDLAAANEDDPRLAAARRRTAAELRAIAENQRNTAELLRQGRIKLREPEHCEIALRTEATA